MTDSLRLIAKVGIIVAALIDILCFKYRNLAHSIIFIECFNHAIYEIMPNKYLLDQTYKFICFKAYLGFLSFYCDKGASIVFSTAMLSSRLIAPMVF